MMTLYNLRGELSPWPVTDRGWQFGDGVFRTALITGGQVQDLQGQIDLLLHDAQVLLLEGVPSAESLVSATQSIASRHEHGRLKWVITSGDSPGGYSRMSTVRVRIAISPLQSPKPAQEFADVWVCQTQVQGGHAWAHVKHLNRLENVMARREQPIAKFQEGLMCDADGLLVSGISSNVFWVDASGRLCTNPLVTAGLHGRTRARIIDILARQRRELLFVEEKAQDVLHSAREIFLCNSLWGCKPVRRCGDWQASSDATAQGLNVALSAAA